MRRYDYRLDGKRKTAALGSFPEVSLKDAADRVAEYRKIIREGRDPVAEKTRTKAEARQKELERMRTFEQVVTLFQALREWTGHGSLRFLSPFSASKPITDVGLLNGLCRLGYGREEMCIHGFRSMASTLLNEQGYRPDVIEAQLAHGEKNAVRAAYNHAQYMDERCAMMQTFADMLDTLRVGGAERSPLDVDA